MKNRGNERNINHNNRDKNKGKKLKNGERCTEFWEEENPEKQVSLENSGSLPLEQPWKPDLLRRNSRKDGLPEKQTSSVATGSYNKSPVEKKTKLQKTKKQDRGRPTKGILFLPGWSSSIGSLQDSTSSSSLKQHSRKRKDDLGNRGSHKKKKSLGSYEIRPVIRTGQKRI